MSLITMEGDHLWLYVAGELGQMPAVIAYSLETAMIRLLSGYTVGDEREQSGYPEQWACGFLDAETEEMLWTLTLVTHSRETITSEPTEKKHALYILKCSVEKDQWDEETGWRK